MSVRYVVHADNALCYVDQERNDLLMGVLAGDIFKGGPDPKNGPITKSGAVRPATLADFKRFRVMPPPGFTIPPEDAQLGDPCGLLFATGADGQADICPGTLNCYVDVHGTPRGCACHISPPCHACLSAPLACATCLETVP